MDYIQQAKDLLGKDVIIDFTSQLDDLKGWFGDAIYLCVRPMALSDTGKVVRLAYNGAERWVSTVFFVTAIADCVSDTVSPQDKITALKNRVNELEIYKEKVLQVENRQISQLKDEKGRLTGVLNQLADWFKANMPDAKMLGVWDNTNVLDWLENHGITPSKEYIWEAKGILKESQAEVEDLIVKPPVPFAQPSGEVRENVNPDHL